MNDNIKSSLDFYISNFNILIDTHFGNISNKDEIKEQSINRILSYLNNDSEDKPQFFSIDNTLSESDLSVLYGVTKEENFNNWKKNNVIVKGEAEGTIFISFMKSLQELEKGQTNEIRLMKIKELK